MRADVVIVMTPLLQNDLRFFQRVKSFTVETFIAQATIEALVVAVFPWAARLDVQGLYAQLR